MQIQTFCAYMVHNFSLNFRYFGYSIFLQIQTIRTSNLCNFLLHLRNSGYSNFLQIQTYCTYNVHNYVINFAILEIQYFYKSKESEDIMCTISRWIYAILIFNFSANPAICTYNLHNFSLNLRNSGCSIFLEIKLFCTFNVHNYSLNLRYSGYSIFLQNQTILKYNIHNYSLNLR